MSNISLSHYFFLFSFFHIIQNGGVLNSLILVFFFYLNDNPLRMYTMLLLFPHIPYKLEYHLTVNNCVCILFL